MFFKKKKEIEKLKEEVDYQKHLAKNRSELIKDLEDNIRKIEEMKYEDYDWAVLCKDYKLTVINGGKVEKGVRRVTVQSNYDIIPTITIEK